MKPSSNNGNWVYDDDPKEFISLCPDFFDSENIICKGCPYKNECIKDEFIEKGETNE